jgi:D-glycero-D-manno-heptose 1,7-bisphosphate phosphatase
LVQAEGVKRAVFLDLNGTLVMPVQVNAPEELSLIPGSIEAVRLLNAAGFVCPVITVQSRIEKRIFTREAFDQWFQRLQADFAEADAILAPIYVCPHSFRTGCDCHKPKPKLYLDAARDLNLDVRRSYVVGDTYGDIQAGHRRKNLFRAHRLGRSLPRITWSRGELYWG